MLEKSRAEKIIGKSLEAEVTFDRKDDAESVLLYKYLGSLPELLNVSAVHESAGGGGNSVASFVAPASGTKCDRCWRYTEDVGNDENYPTVCLRCAEALHAIHFAPYTSNAQEAQA
jgi:isoleucyl-tRNA synthetase